MNPEERTRKREKYHKGDHQGKIYHLWGNSKLDKLQTPQCSGNSDETKWYPTRARSPICTLGVHSPGGPSPQDTLICWVPNRIENNFSIDFIFWINTVGHTSIGNNRHPYLLPKSSSKSELLISKHVLFKLALSRVLVFQLSWESYIIVFFFLANVLVRIALYL